MRVMPARTFALGGIAVLIALQPSALSAQGDVGRGRAMAEEQCARCHAIAGPGPSPVAQAPLFSGFERQWPVEYLAEAFAEGIATGHGPVRMPQFVFTPEEIDDLLAYLKSVQE